MKCPRGNIVPYSNFDPRTNTRPKERSFAKGVLEERVLQAHKRVLRCLLEFPICPHGGTLSMRFDLGAGIAYWQCDHVERFKDLPDKTETKLCQVIDESLDMCSCGCGLEIHSEEYEDL